MPESKSKNLYADSGVDVAKGDRLVDWLQGSASKTQDFPRGQLLSAGGFAGLFRPNFKGLTDPLLVSGTDGVGTKVLLGIQTGQLSGLGIDLVAMCVNDLYTVGARPLFFLDYYATAALDETGFKQVLTGIREGCQQSQAALLGGETAEMPGLYKKGDFDLAGFVVGVVDGEKTLGSHRVRSGDPIYALPSSGFHSNGYSLIRKWLSDSPQTSDNLDQVLTPTRIYHEIPDLLEELGPSVIHAMANITGGGFTGNVPRVLPKGTQANLDLTAFRTPRWMETFIADRGHSLKDVEGVFNLGVGMIACIDNEHKTNFETQCRASKLDVFQIGEVASSNDATPSVSFV